MSKLTLSKQDIAAAYQNLIRQAYPKVVVRPNSNQWNPHQDECFDAFFLPDDAGAEYLHNCIDENGWYDQAEKWDCRRCAL